MSRWFRVYAEMIDDPKVQRLPDAAFKALINLWCIAATNDGTLPPVPDVAFKLRVTEKRADELLSQLTEAGFIDVTETGMRPHNWDGRQFKSDVSNERVKRHREQKRNERRNVTRNKPVSPPDTETETEAAQHSSVGKPGAETEKPEPVPPPAEEISPEPPDTAGLPSKTPSEELGIPWFLDKRPERFDKLEAELREAAGLENDPSPQLFDTSPIVELLDKRYPLSLILGKLREAKARKVKPKSWRYFVPAITEAHQANASIPENQKDRPAEVETVWINKDDPRWSDLADRWERDRGREPPASGSKGQAGIGWFFPADWIEKEKAA